MDKSTNSERTEPGGSSPVTPEPYVSAPTPPLLTFEEYEALAIERSTAVEKYDEAVNKHKEWKMAKAKEAHTVKRLCVRRLEMQQRQRH